MLNGTLASPLRTRRNCSKKGTMAAGFSSGISAVRSRIPVTSSDACVRAATLTGGVLGTGFEATALRLTVFFFFGFGGVACVVVVGVVVVDVVVDVWENRK